MAQWRGALPPHEQQQQDLFQQQLNRGSGPASPSRAGAASSSSLPWAPHNVDVGTPAAGSSPLVTADFELTPTPRTSKGGGSRKRGAAAAPDFPAKLAPKRQQRASREDAGMLVPKPIKGSPESAKGGDGHLAPHLLRLGPP
jgi:hypothetical protein